MVAKVRLVRGVPYVFVNFKGRRKAKKCSSIDRAHEIAKKLNDALELYGLDALRILEPPATPRRIPTLAEYAPRWLETLRRAELKETTKLSYRSHLKAHALPNLGALRLDEITYSVLKDLVFKLRDEDYSKDTIRLVLVTINEILKEATEERVIAAAPVDKRRLAKFYRRPRVEQAIRREDIFSVDEIHSIEDAYAARAPEYFACVLTMSRTGIRIGEARGLRSSDLDYRRGLIRIERNIPVGFRDPVDPKTVSSNRSVKMRPELAEALRAHEAERKRAWFAKGEPVPDLLFPEPDRADALDYQHFMHRWRTIVKALRIRLRPPHMLRHSWASHMLASGEDLTWVSRQLGHRSPAVTLAIYTHFVDRDLEGTGNALDRRSDASRTQVKGDSGGKRDA